MEIGLEKVVLPAQKERIFLLVNDDLTLEYISEVSTSNSNAGDGDELAVGSFLPDFWASPTRESFVANLKKGFSGRCFTFEGDFLDNANLPKRTSVTVTPAQIDAGKVRSISLSIGCQVAYGNPRVRLDSEELVGKVFNSVSLGLCILDRNGLFVDLNRTFCRMFEGEREGLIGRRFSEIVQSTQQGLLEKLHETNLESVNISFEETDLTLTSGRIITLSVRCSRLVSSTGEEFLVVTLEDITGIRKLQAQLGTFSSKLQGLVFRYARYPDGSDRMLYMSPGAEKIYGFESSAILEDMSLLWNSVDLEYLEGFKSTVAESGKDLQEWNYTFKYNHPDGSQRWLQGCGTPQGSGDGVLIWDALILDVTEETETRLRFEKKEQLFNSLMDDGVEMMALLDAEGKYVFTSPSFLHKLGYEAEELKGVDSFSKIHPDYVDQVRQDLTKLLTQDKASTKPYLKRKKDGSYIWLRTTGTNMLEDPSINGIVINSVEITDLILAEQGVKASEVRYKYLFENNPAAMMIWAFEDGKILDVNSPCENMYGYGREEFLTKTVYDIRPQEDVQWMKSLGVQAYSHLKPGDKFYTGVSRHIKKNGVIIDVEIDSRIIDYQGKRASMVLTFDVTEKLKIQNEIKQSEAKYRTIFDMSPLPMYIYRVSDLRIMDVNERAQLHYGYCREEFLKMSTLDIRPESEVEKFMESYREILSKTGPQNMGIFVHLKKSGQKIQAEVTGQKVQFQDSECMMVVAKDVTGKILREKLDYLERQVMEQTILEGNSLEERLEKYLKGIEELLPEAKMSIVKLRGGVVSTLASPSLPPEFVREVGEFNLAKMTDLWNEPSFLEESELERLHATDPKWRTVKKYCDREDLKSCYFQPIIDADQQLVGAFGIFFSGTQKPEQWMGDHFFRIGNRIGLILENHLKSKELKLSNERYNYVNLATRDALYDFDLNQNKLYFGQSYERLTGCVTDKGIVDLSVWLELIHPADRLRVTNSAEEAILDPNQHLFLSEYKIRRDDNSYAHVVDRGFIVRDAAGKAIRVVGVLSDVTERKAFEVSLKLLNGELETRNKELALSNAELEQFAYVASHDLQEPLRMISSFMAQLELKYKDQLDEKAQRYIYFAVDGAKRMRQIILDLLEFSRVGRLEEEKTDVSLNEIMEHVKALHRNQKNTAGVQINYPDLPVIRASRTPILQVFQNLITNAVKYSKEEVMPCVDISVQDRGEFWEFQVKDNGIGIEESNYDKIFIIFQRLHTRDKYTGTGIGLSIVKKILENMGGKIWVESQVNVGSSFYFTLPK